MSELEPHVEFQFSLGGLFVAITTTAVAIGIVLADWPPLTLKMLAACVPVFWGGTVLFICGAALRESKLALFALAGELTIGLAVMIIVWSAVAAFVCACVSIVVFVMSGLTALK